VGLPCIPWHSPRIRLGRLQFDAPVPWDAPRSAPGAHDFGDLPMATLHAADLAQYPDGSLPQSPLAPSTWVERMVKTRPSFPEPRYQPQPWLGVAGRLGLVEQPPCRQTAISAVLFPLLPGPAQAALLQPITPCCRGPLLERDDDPCLACRWSFPCRRSPMAVVNAAASSGLTQARHSTRPSPLRNALLSCRNALRRLCEA
jgi:hypothetical protein